MARDSYISFEYATRHYFPLPNFVTTVDYQVPSIISSIEDRPESLILKSIDESWNQHRFKYYNKITTIKDTEELGLVEGTFIHSIRYKDKKYSENKRYFDLVIPLVMRITDYRDLYLKLNMYYAFRDKAIQTITKKRDMNSSSGRSITLVSKEIAGSEVSLKIDGNININGQIIFEDKELVGINQTQNKITKITRET